MKLKVIDRGTRRGWQANVYDDEGRELLSSSLQSRPGCAIREVLNELYGKYGQPHTNMFEWSLDEW